MLAIDNRKLLILTAVQIEARAIDQALALSTAHPLPTAPPMQLRPIGVRATHMPPDLSAQTVRCIIMTGLAGALDPALQCGQIVIDGWPTHLPIDPAYRLGAIHTADHIVATIDDKARLYHQTGALAVDMESALVRQVAQQRGIPFLAIRAIGDTAADALDPAVLNFTDDFGRPKPLALASALLRRPMLVPHLRKLQQTSALALHALADALKRILSGPGPWTLTS
ncbi:MAG TPA: hypothetical protein VHP11_04470 [Tepidisphaeraceae bacterium]|nr:hypothetical protein [Tepidisphaeraceae bacterium]